MVDWIGILTNESDSRQEARLILIYKYENGFSTQRVEKCARAWQLKSSALTV